MTATAAQIAQVRRMVNEPTVTPYSDAAIQGYIEAYPLLDERGEGPYYYNTLAVPPTPTDNTNWITTYDLHAAAADIWEEKAAAVAAEFDFSADGGNYSASQKFAMYMRQSKHHRARRSIKTVTLVPWVKSLDDYSTEI